jgi:hypothetical protein
MQEARGQQQPQLQPQPSKSESTVRRVIAAAKRGLAATLSRLNECQWRKAATRVLLETSVLQEASKLQHQGCVGCQIAGNLRGAAMGLDIRPGGQTADKWVVHKPEALAMVVVPQADQGKPGDISRISACTGINRALLSDASEKRQKAILGGSRWGAVR